jgi:hypothetical protein
MDQDALVTEQIQDGKRLTGQLRQDGFDVEGAFWLYDGEAGRWRLYIVTNETSKGTAAAYKTVQRTIYKLQPIWLDPFEVTLTDPTDSRVAAIRDFHAKHPTTLATNVRRQYLGGVYFDNAYIYPPLTNP